MTSSRDDWWSGNNPLTEITTEGTKIYSTSSSEGKLFKTTPLSVPCSMEFTWLEGGGTQYYSAIFSSRLATANVNCVWSSYWVSDSCMNVDGYYSGDKRRYASLSSGDKIKLVLTSSTFSAYLNGELKCSRSYTSLSTVYCGFYTKSDRWQKVKDLKVKPYTEE